MPALKPVKVVCVSPGGRVDSIDRAATEEPLELRLHGRPFAVIMRTPGADRELAAGFLLSEGVLKHPDDLGTIDYCTDAAASAENVINVTLAGVSFDGLERVLAGRRQVLANSSCGLCGRLTIESLQVEAGPLPAGPRVSPAVISGLPATLRAHQVVFDETGGLHAAGLFTADGGLETSAEDVGRHNAVDKVIGRMVMSETLPLSNYLLCVSGRVSFEIVQKALLAGIPMVAAVSAPSTLAIELARETGMTLAAFVRGDSFNVYAHAERIR